MSQLKEIHLPLHIYDIGIIYALMMLGLLIWYRLRSDFQRNLVIQDWKENMLYLVTIHPPPEWVGREDEGAQRGVFCPDARCLAAEAFIKIAGVAYEKVPSHQARGQSPTHGLPLLELNGHQHCDLTAIIETIVSAAEGAKAEQLAQQLAARDPELLLLHSHLDTNLYYSIERQRWDMPENYPVVVQNLLHWTPAVIRSYGGYLQRRHSMRTCWAQGVMRQRSVGRFKHNVERQVDAIEKILELRTDTGRIISGEEGDQVMARWLDGPSPGPTDCVVYGHIRQIIDDPLPRSLVQASNPHCHAFVKAMYRYLEAV